MSTPLISLEEFEAAAEAETSGDTRTRNIGDADGDPSNDLVEDETTTSDTTDRIADPELDLIEESLGTTEGTDQATGSQILSGGGATTAAGSTASGSGTDIDPEASRNVAESTERMVEGDDPDVDPDEAFERAQAAAEQAAPDVDNVNVAGREVHPFLLAALALVAVAGHQVFG